MRLALVTETYPPEVNGVAMTLERLVMGLADLGHPIEVIRPKQSKMDANTDQPHGEQGGRIQQITVPGLPIPRYDGLHFGLPAKRKLLKRWRETKPDVVHIATEGPLGLTALWAAKKLNIPITSSYHTQFHHYGEHYGYSFATAPLMAFFRYLHNNTACTLVPSQDVVDELTELAFKNVKILARGVDTELFGPHRRNLQLREQWGADDDTLVVAYVGRVAGEKNIPLAVEAYEAMKAKSQRPMKFVIVGDGPVRKQLETKHPEYIFAGMQRGEALAEHYASADLFVFASVTETFGNVVTEAMASGLAVLAYDYAAPGRFIENGTNGFVAHLNDATAFIAAAKQMIQNPDQLKAIGQAASQTLQGHSWHAIVKQYESILKEAIQSR